MSSLAMALNYKSSQRPPAKRRRFMTFVRYNSLYPAPPNEDVTALSVQRYRCAASDPASVPPLLSPVR
jgi:hypothetical protein